MSMTPAFEIGLWNAWILVVPWLSVNVILPYLVVNRESAVFSSPPYGQGQRLALVISQLTVLSLAIYSVFLPLVLNTALCYIGLIVYLLGLAVGLAAYVNASSTAPDQPVTSGVFRVTRNPMYLGTFLVFIGIGLAAAAWIYLLGSVVAIVLLDRTLGAEEAVCQERFADDSRRYADKTPKWIGMLRK